MIKTLYLLRFMDDEAYRRRILVQLNRGEGRYQLIVSCSMASGTNCDSATEKVRKTNSGRLAWW